jgi:four helix bundle protein
VKERKRFLDFAKGSLGEFKTQADIGVEIEYIPRNIGEKWLSESQELARMLGALIKQIDEG